MVWLSLGFISYDIGFDVGMIGSSPKIEFFSVDENGIHGCCAAIFGNGYQTSSFEKDYIFGSTGFLTGYVPGIIKTFRLLIFSTIGMLSNRFFRTDE